VTAPLTIDATGWWITQLKAGLAADIGSKTPDDLQSEVPFVAVERIGGPNDGIAIDMPTMAFHCFGSGQQAANQLAYQVLRFVHDQRGKAAAGAVVTHVRTLSGPSRAAVTDPSLGHAVVLMQTRIKIAS